jgi:hypothetical protein
MRPRIERLYHLAEAEFLFRCTIPSRAPYVIDIANA